MDFSFLKDLHPGWIGGVTAVALVWIVLNYLKTNRITKTVERVSTHDAALVGTLSKIDKSITAQTTLIEAQTELTREMASSLKRVIHDVDELRDDLELVSEDVKEIKKTQKQGE